MTDYRVEIPDEHYQILTFSQENLPGVAVINSALQVFEPRIVFRWHLELVHKYLQQIISDNSSPRQFDYRIDPDDEWKLAEWHLKDRS